MLCRILLAGATILYIVCVLLLSGLTKEDVDSTTLDKLQQHNVDLEKISTEETRQKCITSLPNSVETTTLYETTGSPITVEPNTDLKSYVFMREKSDNISQLNNNDNDKKLQNTTAPDFSKYLWNITNPGLLALLDSVKANYSLIEELKINNDYKDLNSSKHAQSDENVEISKNQQLGNNHNMQRNNTTQSSNSTFIDFFKYLQVIAKSGLSELDNKSIQTINQYINDHKDINIASYKQDQREDKNNIKEIKITNHDMKHFNSISKSSDMNDISKLFEEHSNIKQPYTSSKTTPSLDKTKSVNEGHEDYNLIHMDQIDKLLEIYLKSQQIYIQNDGSLYKVSTPTKIQQTNKDLIHLDQIHKMFEIFSKNQQSLTLFSDLSKTTSIPLTTKQIEEYEPENKLKISQIKYFFENILQTHQPHAQSNDGVYKIPRQTTTTLKDHREGINVNGSLSKLIKNQHSSIQLKELLQMKDHDDMQQHNETNNKTLINTDISNILAQLLIKYRNKPAELNLINDEKNILRSTTINTNKPMTPSKPYIMSNDLEIKQILTNIATILNQNENIIQLSDNITKKKQKYLNDIALQKILPLDDNNYEENLSNIQNNSNKESNAVFLDPKVKNKISNKEDIPNSQKIQNVIEDIANKIKDTIIKDLKKNSPTEETTERVTYDDKVIRDFLKAIKQFNQGNSLSSGFNYETHQGNTSVTSKLNNEFMGFQTPYYAHQNNKVSLNIKPRLGNAPLTIQSNVNDIPPIFAPNTVHEINIIIATTPRSKMRLRTQKKKERNLLQVKQLNSKIFKYNPSLSLNYKDDTIKTYNNGYISNDIVNPNLKNYGSQFNEDIIKSNSNQNKTYSKMITYNSNLVPAFKDPSNIIKPIFETKLESNNKTMNDHNVLMDLIHLNGFYSLLEPNNKDNTNNNNKPYIYNNNVIQKDSKPEIKLKGHIMPSDTNMYHTIVKDNPNLELKTNYKPDIYNDLIKMDIESKLRDAILNNYNSQIDFNYLINHSPALESKLKHNKMTINNNYKDISSMRNNFDFKSNNNLDLYNALIKHSSNLGSELKDNYKKSDLYNELNKGTTDFNQNFNDDYNMMKYNINSDQNFNVASKFKVNNEPIMYNNLIKLTSALGPKLAENSMKNNINPKLYNAIMKQSSAFGSLYSDETRKNIYNAEMYNKMIKQKPDFVSKLNVDSNNQNIYNELLGRGSNVGLRFKDDMIKNNNNDNIYSEAMKQNAENNFNNKNIDNKFEQELNTNNEHPNKIPYKINDKMDSEILNELYNDRGNMIKSYQHGNVARSEPDHEINQNMKNIMQKHYQVRENNDWETIEHKQTNKDIEYDNIKIRNSYKYAGPQVNDIQPESNNKFDRKEHIKNIIDKLDREIEARAVKVNERQLTPLRNKKKVSSYDDTHFKEFLKTQEKVNDMLERLLSVKPHNRLSSVEAM